MAAVGKDPGRPITSFGGRSKVGQILAEWTKRGAQTNHDVWGGVSELHISSPHQPSHPFEGTSEEQKRG